MKPSATRYSPLRSQFLMPWYSDHTSSLNGRFEIRVRRHILTIREQIRGVRGAIASPRTPDQLKRSLLGHLRKLEANTPRKSRRPRGRAQKRAGLLDWKTGHGGFHGGIGGPVTSNAVRAPIRICGRLSVPAHLQALAFAGALFLPLTLIPTVRTETNGLPSR